jgi:DNA gyrase subunit B
MAALGAVARLGNRYDPHFLNQLIDFEAFNPEWDRPEADRWCGALEERMNAASAPSVRYALGTEETEQGYALTFDRITHGVVDRQRLRREFFRSPEYRLIGGVAQTLHGLVQPGAIVRRGKASEPVSDFAAAYDWLMAESRKGRAIQRFKGLGEMNPEQLWDTTVNPETRRLLQVTIEDAVAADEIFSTLMGDEVEPRRDFIENNALDAANLDV